MRSSFRVAVIAVAAAIGSPAAAVDLGEIDTFSSSIENWFAGGGPGGAVPALPPAVAPGGGPQGSSDPYLRLTATGHGGPGARLVAMNASQWAGDYLAAGITAIEMDLLNLGPTDLTIRLLFEDPASGPPMNIAVTNFGALLPAAGGWTHVSFPIAPGDMTALLGNATAALAGATVLRLFHGAPVTFPPETISATLGVDNITAVPEPAMVVLMLAGLGLVGLRTLTGRACSGT